MGLWSFFRKLLFGEPSAAATRSPGAPGNRRAAPRRRVKLVPLRFARPTTAQKRSLGNETTSQPQHPFAARNPRTGEFLDLQTDGDAQALRDWHLPVIESVPELAAWLELPVGKLAWLTGRFGHNHRPLSVEDSHYVYHWRRKKSGGERLIESPKPALKRVQQQLLREILDRVPLHPAAHAFRSGHSILTNARPHLGKRIVLKFDLQNFYPSVKFNRVVGIFRSLGYNREVAIWLGRLTTTAIPSSMPFPSTGPASLRPYLSSRLPQGAPTSPALANLSAYSLDVRLAGLAGAYKANYTRYADDVTFSGPQGLFKALKNLIPLAEQVIRSERFFVHRLKRRVLRNNQRQTVTGVVVNEHPNVSRPEFDRLKAILFNCVRFGPQSQNRDGHADFAAVLRGRIAHVRQLNPRRADKLLRLYERIRW